LLSVVFFLIFIASIVGLIIGLFRPQAVVRWGQKRTRSRAVLIYTGAALVSFILFGATVPKNESTVPPPSASEKSTTTNHTADTTNSVSTSAPGNNSTDTKSSNTSKTENATAKTSTRPSSSSSSKTSSSSVPKGLIPVVVTRDVDGDTIHVNLHGKDETIRMLLIDTPEDVDPVKPVEPYGPTAAAYARSVLPVGKHIYIQEGHPGYTRDKYGRLLAYVYITPHDMYNVDVVKKGYARVAYIYPPNTDHLSQLEAAQSYAKSHHLGIWSLSGYVTSEGYNLSVACTWAADHGYSTHGCSGQAPSHSSESTHHSSGSSSTTTHTSTTTTSSHPSVVSSNLNVSPGDYASVTVKATPGARGTIEVDYESGPSHAQGLDPKNADASGEITWTWKVGTRTHAGDWPVIITIGGQTIKLTLHVH
jgi:micrococcal nuclease